jgi:hypothetical protein
LSQSETHNEFKHPRQRALFGGPLDGHVIDVSENPTCVIWLVEGLVYQACLAGHLHLRPDLAPDEAVRRPEWLDEELPCRMDVARMDIAARRGLSRDEAAEILYGSFATEESESLETEA